jgi:acetaldehyde dehydrogenase (acetylating)
VLEDRDLQSIQEARNLLRKAAEAQKVVASWDQDALDRVVAAMAEAGRQAARRLAELAVEETGFGVVADKETKNLVATEKVCEFIKGMKTVGIIRQRPEKGIIEVGTPMGVVLGIIPSTNPTSTAMYKALISVKAGNAIIMSPHPAAAKCILEATRVVAAAGARAGMPEGLVSCMTIPTMAGTRELLHHELTSVILATGGTGLVRAAYSAGKPAYGVGPGNVPAYIESSADVPRAVADIVAGKTFDNGTVCASEQAVIADRAIAAQVVSELKKHGGYFLPDEDQQALSRVIVSPKGGINPRIVGQPATRIAEMAGIRVPPDTRVLIAPLDGVGPKYPLSMEKLSPILAFYEVPDWRKACELCFEILEFGGIGHTLAIHSRNEEIILEFGLKKPAYRVIVNSPSTHGAIGLTTGLDPALTLGCGTLGGSITADNVHPGHLINVKRIAYDLRSREQASTAAGTPAARSAVLAGAGIEERIRAIVRQVVQERMGRSR